MSALESHLEGDRDTAGAWLRAANSPSVWRYTDQAWGKGAAKRYSFVKDQNSPPSFAMADRPQPRMPTAATKKKVIERDGYHCRFCGIPVIDPKVRQFLAKEYPDSVAWGTTNDSQHAAFQCMWLQWDHILPNSRGGESDFENIVVTCAPCNFGRMEATLEEARLTNPLDSPPPIIWKHHDEWDGLERFFSKR